MTPAPTRKFGAHYILLPGHPLARRSLVLWREGAAPCLQPLARPEEHALEFHGGMIVAAHLRDQIGGWKTGDHILARVAAAYAATPRPVTGLLLLQGANWNDLTWTDRARATLLTPHA
jgi:hypothetical protein